MADSSKGVLIARDVCALDIAATKARARSFYAKRKTKTNPRLASAIQVAHAVLAYGMDSRPVNPTGHPNAKTIIPIGERPQGFSRPQVSSSVDIELPRPGLPASHNDVTAALRTLDAGTEAVAQDAGLTIQQIINSL